MTDPTPELPQPARESSGLVRDVALWLGAVILGGGGVFWLLDGLRVRDWWPFRHALAGSDMYDLTRSTVALTGLLGATVAVALAIRRQRSTEQTVRITAEAQLVTAQAYALDVERNSHEQVRDLRDRFTTAAGQLGHDGPAVRLAGVYAMAGLADDWLQREQPEEAQGCIDVLCAYIRTPRKTTSEEDARADLEVRQTIIRTITNRLQPGERTTRDWRGRDFDFTGATFNGIYTFAGAQFVRGRVTFNNAQFNGGAVTFAHAEFAGSDVTFSHAQFAGGEVIFAGAKFSDGFVAFNRAKFDGANLIFFNVRVVGGNLTFESAEFNAGSHFYLSALFTGGTVNFDDAKFIGTDLDFYQARVDGGNITFNGARFRAGNVNFNTCHFANGTASFLGAYFAGGATTFNWAEFTGGVVSFLGALFGRGTVTFENATLTRPVLGPWGDRPPSVWPPPKDELAAPTD